MPVGIIGSTLGGPLKVRAETPRTRPTPSVREQIEGHLSALSSLLKEHKGRRNVSPIHLSFDDEEDRMRVRTVVTEKEVGDADLKRPFKEVVKTSLTRRIIEFAGPEFKCRRISNCMMGLPIRRIISVDSHPQQTRANGPCQCGVLCSSKPWMGVRGDGSRTSHKEASTDGQNLGNNSQPNFQQGEHASKIQRR
ncbi:hypothetical protein Tco_1038707 [Tanacetum coccineum]